LGVSNAANGLLLVALAIFPNALQQARWSNFQSPDQLKISKNPPQYR
jgi:hypothetical protein